MIAVSARLRGHHRTVSALFERPGIVATLYTLVTLAMTWPLARGLARDLPGDLGDPAFVTGIMAWGARQWLALLSGDLGAVARFWDAPFFAPEPTATAYSDHFALHALVTLPVTAVTGNSILSYNLCFLATFVVGALGAYLLVRDLTGHGGAAFVAGLAFAFAPYRIATLGHLQVLSAVGMPWVLAGLRRYFVTGSSDGLRMAGIALWAQNVATGYYLVFFAPFVVLFALVQMWARGLFTRLVVWRDLVVTATLVGVATLPFVLPYLLRGDGARRSTAETVAYSADIMSWLTASPLLRVWGWLQTFPKIEGQLFPGVTIVVLALVGAVLAWRAAFARRAAPPVEDQERARLSATDARATGVFAVLGLVAAVWLSFGPEIQFETHTQPVPSLFAAVVDILPGFANARVPSRFAAIAVLMLVMLGGVALAAVSRWRGGALLPVAAVMLLAEGVAAPLPTNGVWTSAPGEFRPPAARLHRLEEAPAVYRYIATLQQAIVAELPFGLVEREIQSVYYSALHGQRIINGYSGSFPPSYGIRHAAMSAPLANPETTRTILDLDGVTHIVVHRDAWIDASTPHAIVTMLERDGWVVTQTFGADVVLERR